MARRKTLPIPPIKVGTRRITYTDPDGERVFRVHLLALYVNDHSVPEIEAERAHRALADLELPDGRVLEKVKHSGGLEHHAWCRPWLSSIRIN